MPLSQGNCQLALLYVVLLPGEFVSTSLFVQHHLYFRGDHILSLKQSQASTPLIVPVLLEFCRWSGSGDTAASPLIGRALFARKLRPISTIFDYE